MATTLVPAPPYMLGQRPSRAPTAYSCVPSFRQVPFVRISDRVDSGVKVRKQLRKYLKAASATQQMVAQTHLSDACLPALQPQEVAQSCFQDFFKQMRTYSQVLGTKHLAASKAYLDMTKPLENSGKSRRWAKDVYNLVQRCVADVHVAEKKMDKARSRVVRAADDLAHWKTVLSANEATFQVQPNSPEVKKAFQVAQCRFSSAVGEDEAAGIEYDEARTCLIRAIARRDEVVEEATELSQSVEEDRLDTLLIVIGQFVETKVAILQAEIEVMTDLQNTLKAMDRNSVVQQYIVDSMAPGLTHRHAKALGLMEWHRVSWRYEQQLRQSAEPGSCLADARSSKELAKLKASGVSEKDVEIIKDFVSSCFIEPEAALVFAQASSGTISSLKHRSKFTDASASTTQSVYRLGVVRRIILDCLRHQRVHDRELSRDGFSRLAIALRFLLDACVAQHDTRTTMHLMNMLQTFYRKTSKDGQEYLHAALKDHAAWRIAGYWGDALLESVAEELNKAPMDTPWYYLADAERAQKVLDVHNIIFGQASAYLYHLSSFGFSRRQLLQYAHSVCYAYELGEEQCISIYSSVRSMVLDRAQEDEHEEKRQEPMECDDDDWQHTFERDSRQSDRASSRVPAKRTADVQFPPTSFTPPDWSSFSSGGGSSDAGFDSNVSKFGRKRRESTASTATTIMEGSTTASYVGSLHDFEDMKTIASTVIGEDGDESWENLFGTTVACSTLTEDESIPSVLGVGEDTSESSEKHKDKLMKRRKNSRKFNDQLRLARTIPLSLRIHEEEEESVPVPTATAAVHTHAKKELEQPPLPPGRLPASAGTLLRHRSSDNIFMAARRETGDLPPTHGTHSHVLRHESGIATDENGGARLERRRHRKLHKARSVASIDTSVLRAETQQAFNTSRNTIDPADQIKMMAARMKSRREENSDGKIDFVAFSRTRSDATGSTFPSPAAPSQELSSTPKKKKESRTLSGVAALRARFENK
uniref:SBF1/SBF2 domain-containing protein n=1 Tax=Hyaloperonospora arabidopsidis (strain Emoy2) TaxID=559515 RepID=M4C1K9_HYAAE